MKKSILSVMLSVGMAAIPALADIGTFAKKVTFTVDYDGPSGVVDIPVLVRLAANSPEGSGRGRRQVLSRGALPEVTDVSSRTWRPLQNCRGRLLVYESWYLSSCTVYMLHRCCYTGIRI